jgi:toxin ParE1/3/4
VKRIVPREAAERDVDAAVDHYTLEAGEDVARSFVDSLREAYRVIAERPRIGSPRYAASTSFRGLRSRRLRRFPYMVFYFERVDHIDIWRILHAQRDIPAVLGQAGD